MTVIGHVESLWRYPVKSMRGEEIGEAFLGFAGVYGDRLYAFEDTAAPKGFPHLTGRELEQMLLYQPKFRHPEFAAAPPNLAEADALAPGVTPVYPGTGELAVEVQAPSGQVFTIEDPDLLATLTKGVRGAHALSLLRSDRALTDCRPVSIFSIQTVAQLGTEAGAALDKRRFRANVYADFRGMAGFEENTLVGRRLRIGSKAEVIVTEPDARCKMVTIDPDTAEEKPEVLRVIKRDHDGQAGLYGAVIIEGTIRAGDDIVLEA